MQARVRAQLSVNAAALSRFAFGWPVACIILAVYMTMTGATLPELPAQYWWSAWAAGFCQMVATNLIIISFGKQSLVGGTAYMKTETLIVAILGWAVLQEQLGLLIILGIVVAFLGVVMVAQPAGKLGGRLAADWVRGLKSPAALTGLAAALLFAFTAIFIKLSANAVETDSRSYAGLIVLVAVLGFQLIMQGAWGLWREPAQVRAMFAHWRVTGQIGILAALASAGWFVAYAHAPVALVGIVGQTQILWTLGFGRFYLKEPLGRNELLGITLVTIGVVMALASAF